jgi:hypothetical protein
MPIPPCAGNREGDGRKAVEASAIPSKVVGHNHDPLRISIPFPHQDGAYSESGPALRQFRPQSHGLHRTASAAELLEQTNRFWGEVAELIGLQPIGQNADQEMSGKVRWCRPSEHTLPSAPQPHEIEPAQMRNLMS